MPAALRPALTFSPNDDPWVCLAVVTFIDILLGIPLLMEFIPVRCWYASASSGQANVICSVVPSALVMVCVTGPQDSVVVVLLPVGNPLA